MKTKSTIIHSDALAALKKLSDGSVRCCVTSPPYWQKVDYGPEGQLGLERTPEEYVERMAEVFAEVARVVSGDGTLWLNIDATFSSGGRGGGGVYSDIRNQSWAERLKKKGWRKAPEGWQDKELVPIPWMLTLALRHCGWALRHAPIWNKTNGMMESATDRCVHSHEYIIQFVKRTKDYFFDYEASRVPAKSKPEIRDKAAEGYTGDYVGGQRFSPGARQYGSEDGKVNLRSVWDGPTSTYRGKHRNTFPVWLANRCVSISSAVGDTILDPFSGAGTTGVVCAQLRRNYIGIELNSESVQESCERIAKVAPLFNSVEVVA